jgi:hypothetical protein
VGDDGLWLTMRAGPRFVPYGDVDRVAAAGFSGVDVQLQSGEAIPVRFVPGAAMGVQRRLLRDIGERLRAARKSAESPGTAEVLVPVVPLTADWVRNVRALGAGLKGAYRASTISSDTLGSLVTNGNHALALRAAAAIALGASSDDRARSVLAAAAKATAHPALRFVFESASLAPDDRDLLRALRALAEKT